MLKELSVFTASADLEDALNILMATSVGSSRARSDARSLQELASYFGSEAGYSQLCELRARFALRGDILPTREELAQFFSDELLSRKALKLHQGRNVYSQGKARLWERLWLPFIEELAPDDATLELTEHLVSMRTQAGGADVERCVSFLVSKLEALGFEVEIVRSGDHAPLICARRAARGLDGQVAMYGHYDVEDPSIDEWETDPWVLTEQHGRLYGVGIGDNKAALAQRIVLIGELDETPELVWFIQGEEEIGSPLAHEVAAELVGKIDPDIWIEENGYFDPDGTQRLLARTMGAQPSSSAPPDTRLEGLMRALEEDARLFKIGSRHECRGLNKSFFPQGCPFNNAIPEGGRYIAVGLNDPASNIHAPNESVPMWTFPVHARQFQTILRWAAEESPS